MKKDLNKEEEQLRVAIKGNENFFTVPSGYFDELSEKVFAQIEALPDFDKSSPANPFEVPNNYFENLPSIVSERIVKRKSRLEIWLSEIQRPRIAIPIAFATLIILAGIFFMKQKSIVNHQSQEISVEDLRNSTYIQAIDEDLFVDVLASQKEITSDDSLEQYLIDNNIELTQIENNL